MNEPTPIMDMDTYPMQTPEVVLAPTGTETQVPIVGIGARVEQETESAFRPQSLKEPIHLFGIRIHPVRMYEAVSCLQEWIARRDGTCHFVVTPNTDHALLFQEHEEFREAYGNASLVTADGMPVVLASRLFGRSLPQRVTGADLVPAMFSAAKPEAPLRAFLLGSAPGVADRAATKIEDRWPHVDVVGTYSPPLGFENDEEEVREILDRVAAVEPDFLVVGLGAPKQELFVNKYRKQLKASVAVCVGGTIDYLAGDVPRAPLWIRDFGLEWLFRCLSEPRRLAARYLHDAWRFPGLLWKEWTGGLNRASDIPES